MYRVVNQSSKLFVQKRNSEWKIRGIWMRGRMGYFEERKARICIPAQSKLTWKPNRPFSTENKLNYSTKPNNTQNNNNNQNNQNNNTQNNTENKIASENKMNYSGKWPGLV